MKNVLLLFFFLLCLQGRAQTNDSLKISHLNPTIMLDSLHFQVNDINQRLYSFQRQNATSQRLYILSLICSVSSVLILGDFVKTDKLSRIGIPVLAGVTCGLGTVIYLDSFKFLNTKRKIKKYY